MAAFRQTRTFDIVQAQDCGLAVELAADLFINQHLALDAKRHSTGLLEKAQGMSA